jgi:DNA-directed RNA polymerase specialized sigma24 family protein
LLVILDRFDDVEGQLRRQLPIRMVRQWIQHDVRAALESHLGELSAREQASVDWLLNRRPIVKSRDCADEKLPRIERDRLDNFLHRKGLRSQFAFRNAFLVTLYHAYRRCRYSHEEATKLCGLSDPRSMEDKLKEVLKVCSVAEALELAPAEAGSRTLESLVSTGNLGTEVRAPEPAGLQGILLLLNAAESPSQTLDSEQATDIWCTDEEARWLINNFWHYLTRKLSYGIKDADDLDDLAAVVLVRVAKKLPALAAASRVTGQELTLKRSKVADLVRAECQNERANYRKTRRQRKAHQARFEQEMRIRAERLEANLDPQLFLLLNEKEASARSMLQELPEPFREASSQRFLQRRSIRDIASALRVSKRTVNSLICQSLKLLFTEHRRDSCEPGTLPGLRAEQ